MSNKIWIGLHPDDLLDEMANAFNESWDMGATIEDQLQAALKCFWDLTDTGPRHVRESLLYAISHPTGDRP